MFSKKFSLFVGLFVIFSVLTTAIPVSADTIPAQEGDIYVQDHARVLSPQEKTEILSLGRQLEDQTSAQLAVLTVQSIGDTPIETYSNEAYRKFGLGTKEADNGVLLVVALSQKKIRIEVGYGLEGAIPDGKAGRILDENAIPYLKQGKNDQAITHTYQALAKEIQKEYKGQDAPTAKNKEQKKDPFSWFYIIIIVAVIFLDIKFFNGFLTYMILSMLSRGGGGGGGRRGGGGGSSGGGGAGRGW
ncbi:TPM domain-containing protein [Fictibacillus fluitans]|uniref:TPM domain-containing protein n=1 Tax=Fictibacillus fluitans TaxID=3058422 RepID=A0ABT8HZX7_9BACL|nr:TPM domain-containing protein [Fictibacillus sp. NE201]MDN4526306.1 TPM domain-containing protein [Fictibacillus sp. NE201]